MKEQLRRVQRIAVDLDDTLLACMPGLAEWYNREYGQSLRLEQYDVTPPELLWGVDSWEACQICQRYHGTVQEASAWVGDSREVLTELAGQGRELYVISARWEGLQELTERQVQTYLPGIFQEVICCTRFDDQRVKEVRSKAEFCQERGIGLLIDDSLGHVLRCQEVGILALLMDMGWNQTDQLPAGILRITEGWQEIRSLLL